MVKNALTGTGAFARCQPSHHCIHPLQPIVYYRLHSLMLDKGIRSRQHLAAPGMIADDGSSTPGFATLWRTPYVWRRLSLHDII